jgi:PAS domain S-box-containing protein
MVEDITDKKRAEEARFLHAAIVESSDDAIISKNLDGVIVSWNGGAQRIYGYTEGEAFGKPITILVPRELGSLHRALCLWRSEGLDCLHDCDQRDRVAASR